jgi:hypothetical protein
MRGIFDYSQAVSARQSKQGVHVAGLARQVHRDDGPCTRGDGRSGPRDVHGQGVVVDVDEDRTGVEVADHLGRRREGGDGDKHLIAGPQANGLKGQVQGGGA